MARQKSTFSVPLQTDILSGGNVGLSFGNGPLPVGDLSISIFFLIGIFLKLVQCQPQLNHKI